MGIPMAYNTGTTNTYTEKTVKRGTVALNPDPTLAPSYNWFNGVDVTSSQYLIYSDTYTMGQATQANSRPTAWTTPDLTDTSLLNLINTLPERIGQTTFTYLPVALKWLHQSNRYFLLKNNFENIVTSGLVLNLDGSWPNSFSGTTTWYDLSSSNKNATLTNGPTLSTNNGGSVQFDGTNDYATINQTLTTPITITGFVKYNAPGQTLNTWVNSYPHTVLGISLNRLGGGQIYVYIGNGSGWQGVPGIISSTNMSANTWYHLAFVSDGTSSTLYLNGVNVGSSIYSPSGWGSKYFLGWIEYNGNGEYLNGNIGNTQVYNRALSPAEIMQNFNAQGYRFGYSADTIVTSGLTLYLDASNAVSNPGSGSTWYDMSVSKSNNISLINGASFSTFSGGTIYLDGTNDYGVSVKDSNILGASPRTYIGWYYIIGVSGAWGNLMTTGNNDCSNLMFGWARQGSTLMTWGGCYDLDSGLSLPLNTWLFIAASYDGVNYDAYVNTNTVRLNRSAYNTTESKIFLGAETTNNGSSFRGYMNGHIGSFYQYNRALSASEITQMYNATKGRFGL